MGLPDRLTVDGVSWWYRRRLGYWLWLHERLLWRPVVDAVIEQTGPIDRIELETRLPALVEVATRIAERDGIAARTLPDPAEEAAADPTPAATGSMVERVFGAPRRRARRRELARRAEVLASRVDGLALGDRRFLFLTDPGVHQVIRTAAGERRTDAFLGGVVERLAERGQAPVVIDVAADPRDDLAWAALAADPLRLPSTLLATRWNPPVDAETSAERSAALVAAIDAAPEVPLVDGGIDLGPLLRSGVRGFAGSGLSARLMIAARVARMLRELRPAEIVLINEYGRTEWLAGARMAGVPVFAVQHGDHLPRGTSGYRPSAPPRHPHAADPDVPLRRTTRRRVLIDGTAAISPAEVEVTGRAADRRGPPPDREPIRRRARQPTAPMSGVELGVAPDDRLLVISTTHERHPSPLLLDATRWTCRARRRPSPNVHLVFKQHPAERRRRRPYRALVAWASPPTAGRIGRRRMTVVRDMDLFTPAPRVGRASRPLLDGAHRCGRGGRDRTSIAMTQAHRDLLGYVEAGVAIPIRDGGDLLAALDAGPAVAASPAAREAFLESHFRPGSASERIAGEPLLAWPA